MAAQIQPSIAKHLRLLNRPYRTSCEYIHPEDYVPAGEFFKLHISESHWIDWNNSTRGNRGITTNPSYVLNLFGNLCGDNTCDLRTEMINHLSQNSDYYGKKIVDCFIMNNIDIIDWLAKMSKNSTPVDEIGIYILSNIFDVHTTVYRRNRLWSTLELKGATETSLVANSDLLLIWVELDRYCILREKCKDVIKPAELTGHVTLDPSTNQLVYTPWNLSETDVAQAVDALDETRVKKEIIEISNDEQKAQTIELGRLVDYDQLHELFVDRSPLHSDTETESESDQANLPIEDNEQDNQQLLRGATDIVNDPEPPTLTQSVPTDMPDDMPDDLQETSPKGIGDNVLHGATEELSQNDLEVLRQELEVSDEELNAQSVIGATCLKQCIQERTLDDAIWKESSSEFLTVDDNILNMLDCSLSIKGLGDREIEIKLDPKPKERATPPGPYRTNYRTKANRSFERS